jgi:hypothetical protein
MARFEVYSGDTLIGWSELESGDPPMGVAFGRFMPGPEYQRIQPRVVAGPHQHQSDLALSVRTLAGSVLLATGGVHITDHSAELGPEGIEVSVLGMIEPSYETVFLCTSI